MSTTYSLTTKFNKIKKKKLKIKKNILQFSFFVHSYPFRVVAPETFACAPWVW